MPEEMVSLVEAIRDSPTLRTWFDAIVKADAGVRVRELARVIAEMRSQDESSALIRAIDRLREPVFLGVTSIALSATDRR